MPRIFISPSLLESGQGGEPFELDHETSKKLTRVLRLTSGETFIAFDGFGREWECALVLPEADENGYRPKWARAVILEEREVTHEALLQLSVAQAIPKGDKMDLVLQKGTELGVVEFWPFEAERSIAKMMEDDAERAGNRAERWRRIVAGAAAQCGRADVPIVHAISDFATTVAHGTNGSRCFMLDEGADAEPLRTALLREPLDDASGAPRVMLLVGPEGGWSQREREWAERYGAEPIGLGRRILRTETAALVAATILQWQVGALG